jgi:hypothetical protein
MADLGIRHLSRTDSPPNFDQDQRFVIKKQAQTATSTSTNTPQSKTKKGALSRFLKFIRGKDSTKKSGTKARQKSTDSASSGISSSGQHGNFNPLNSDENAEGLARVISKDSAKADLERTISGKPHIQVVRSQSQQPRSSGKHRPDIGRRTISGGAVERLSTAGSRVANTPRRANTISGSKVTKNSINVQTTTETSTSDSSSTGYLSDESQRRKRELKLQNSRRMTKNSRKTRDETTEESTSTSGESYSSSEDSVYSSAELENGSRNTTNQDESESSSSHSEVTGTGGETTEMEAVQQYALETIPENEEEDNRVQSLTIAKEQRENYPSMQSHHSHHSHNSSHQFHHGHQIGHEGTHHQHFHHSHHELQLDSDEGSLLDEKIYRKEMARKSSDNDSNGLHKPKPIWRRRTARPMSFNDSHNARDHHMMMHGYGHGGGHTQQIIPVAAGGSGAGGQKVLRSESLGPGLQNRMQKFERSATGNVKALAKKLQAQTEEQEKEDDIYLASQFARARRFFRSGSHEGQISNGKNDIPWFGDSHDNDDDLLLEASAPTNLTTRRAGISQVREGRASLSRKNSFPSAAAAQAANALPLEPSRGHSNDNQSATSHYKNSNSDLTGGSAVQRSTSRVRQIAMSLHEREEAVRNAEAMIANHQPLVDHAASASSSSEKASTGHPSPQHKPRNLKKTDDSFIKELLEIARAESQEKHRGVDHIISPGNRSYSQNTLEGEGVKLVPHVSQEQPVVVNPSAAPATAQPVQYIVDEDGNRKPKDFKEAISMASNRMIRKKQPSQDMTEPEMDPRQMSKDEDHQHAQHHHRRITPTTSSEQYHSSDNQPRKRATSSDYQYQSQVKLLTNQFQQGPSSTNLQENNNNPNDLHTIHHPQEHHPTSSSKTKTKKVIRKVRRVSKKVKNTAATTDSKSSQPVEMPSQVHEERVQRQPEPLPEVVNATRQRVYMRMVEQNLRLDFSIFPVF